MSQADNGFKTQIRLDFAQPSALDRDVIGIDADSGDSTFVFQTPNVIEDITNVIDPASTVSFTLFTQRLNNNRTRLGTTQQFSTAFTGNIRPIFPKFIGAGQVKFVIVQTVGTTVATSLVITTRTPLVA